MDFCRVLETLHGFFQARGERWGVIGGIGLAAYGLARTTLDIDLVVDARAQPDLVSFLAGLGYETLHRSDGYSNHLHPDAAWGRVDCVYVRGETSERLFASLRELPGPRGIVLPVPRPEHLAAMKVLAMKNDPDRVFQEMADIRFLLGLDGVDRGEVRGYFERHGLGKRFDELDATA